MSMKVQSVLIKFHNQVIYELNNYRLKLVTRQLKFKNREIFKTPLTHTCTTEQ